MRFGLLVLLALASACKRPAPAAPACSPGTWGLAAYDALYEPPALIFELRDEALLARAGPAAEQLEAAAAADPAPLPPAARVALQNDAWGLWQRLEPSTASSPARERLRQAAAALVRRLALGPVELAALASPSSGGPPEAVLAALGPGWAEQGTELSVLSHERLFGLRRQFRIFTSPGERALASQLVALDAAGRPHLTLVPGEVERLAHDAAGIRAARVWELDRRALRCRGPAAALVEVAEVRHVPGAGALRYLAEFDPPAPLAELPCLRCHHDAQAMSLPQAPDLAPPARRRAALLEQLVAPWAAP